MLCLQNCYDDDQIQYDPDFDEVIWGQPVPFKKLKQSLETGSQLTESAELVVKLQIKSADMKQWLAKNGDQIIPHGVRICAKRYKKRVSKVRFESTKNQTTCLP